MSDCIGDLCQGDGLASGMRPRYDFCRGNCLSAPEKSTLQDNACEQENA